MVDLEGFDLTPQLQRRVLVALLQHASPHVEWNAYRARQGLSGARTKNPFARAEAKKRDAETPPYQAYWLVGVFAGLLVLTALSVLWHKSFDPGSWNFLSLLGGVVVVIAAIVVQAVIAWRNGSDTFVGLLLSTARKMFRPPGKPRS
jgi:hypothetical protein